MSNKELKTKVNDGDVLTFLHTVENEQRKRDALKILDLMQSSTGATPKMWGQSIVGFGSYSYEYASGHKGEWMCVGFSPRKQNLAIYIMPGVDHYADLLKNLGQYKTGKSCLYVKKLEDVNLEVLEALIRSSYLKMQQK